MVAKEQQPIRYFNLKEQLVKAGIIKNTKDWWKGKSVFACIHKRRIGKSTDTLQTQDAFWEATNFTQKILYIRNTEEELKTFIRGFNVKFKQKYIISGNYIYKSEWREDGVEIQARRIVIGILAATSTYEKIKSLVEGNNFGMVIWDEFNGFDDNESADYWTKMDKNQYFFLLELIASIEGPSKDMLVVLLGNKVNSQNDILLKWGITIPSITPDYDTVEQRDVTFEGTNFKVRFINGGRKEYPDVGKGNFLFKALATYDPQSERYFNKDDFYVKQTGDIVAPITLKKREVYCYFSIKNNIIEFGKCNGDWYMDLVPDIELENAVIVSLDYDGFALHVDSSDLDEQELMELSDDLTEMIKYREIKFTSVWLKANIMKWCKNYYGEI